MRRGLTVRMVVAGTLLVVVVGTTFAFLLLAIAQLRESAQLSRHARDEVNAADAMERVVIDLETGVRGYVITGEERFLEPWNDARAAFPAQARTLEGPASDNADELRRVRTIVEGVGSYIQEYATPLLDSVRRNDVSRTASRQRTRGSSASTRSEPSSTACRQYNVPVSRCARAAPTRPLAVRSSAASPVSPGRLQAALRRVATLVARGIQPAEIFSAVAEEIRRLLGADSAGIGRFEPDRTSVVVVGGVGVGVGEDPIMSPAGTRVELRDYLAPAVVWRTGRSARVDEDAWSSVSDRSPTAYASWESGRWWRARSS